MREEAIGIAERFADHLKDLESTRSKMETLLAENTVMILDIEQVYAGLFMEIMTSFESLVEHLFVGLLSGTFDPDATGAVPLIDFKNKTLVVPLIQGRSRFVSWMPYGDTEERANLFFTKGLPFTKLTNKEKQTLTHCHLIRNAIAHKSDHAQNQFVNQVLTNQSLMPRERTPTGYLRSIFRGSPSQRRYQDFAYTIASVATRLCS